MKIKYTHTNINAYDWEKLSQFYKDVFGCYTVGPMRDLKGDWFEKVTGIKDAAVKGEHIALPGYPEGEGPTFEIFTYEVPDGERPAHIRLWFCACGFSGRRRRRNLRKIPSAWRNGKRRTGKILLSVPGSDLDCCLRTRSGRKFCGNFKLETWQL